MFFNSLGVFLTSRIRVDARIGRREARCECNDQVEVCG